MNLERYESRTNRDGDPHLAIYGNGSSRLNAAADRRWFDAAAAVALLYDADAGILAIEPVEAGDETTYSLSRSAGQAGADLATSSLLADAFGITPEDIDETVRLSLEWDDEHGVAVADVSPLLADADQEDQDEGGESPAEASAETGGTLPEGDVPDRDDSEVPEWIVDEISTAEDLDNREKLERLLEHLTADGPIERPASEIGAPIGLSGSEVALNLSHIDDDGWEIEKREGPPGQTASNWYVARNDENLSDADGEPADEASADGGAVAVSADDTDRVRDVADEVDTLQALADRLDVDAERARGLAMSASVYSDLQDNPPRPGVDRDA